MCISGARNGLRCRTDQYTALKCSPTRSARLQLMPGDAKIPKIITEKINEIPLYLIATTISNHVKMKGESVIQIRVQKQFHNHYTITVDTRDEYALRVNQEALTHTEGDGHG